MSQILFYLIAILLMQACGTDQPGKDDFFSTDPNHFQYTDRVFPLGYVECNDRFFWNTRTFEDYVVLNPTAEREQKQISLLADDPTMGPTRSGYSTTSSNLSSEERELCYDIFRKINGYIGITEHRLAQYFNYESVIRSLASRELTSVDASEGLLLHSAFSLNKQHEKEKLVYELRIPISVSCEKPWLFWADPETTHAVVVKQPEGKCNFSTKDYQMVTPSGQKVSIMLRGYYERDDKYPQQSTLVKIEQFAYKRISP